MLATGRAPSSHSAVTDSVWETRGIGLVEFCQSQDEEGSIFGGGEKPREKRVGESSEMLWKTANDPRV